MFCADPPIEPTGVSANTHEETPVTPAYAVIGSGVPDSAEYVVDPEERADNSIHAGLITRFLQAYDIIEAPLNDKLRCLQ